MRRFLVLMVIGVGAAASAVCDGSEPSTESRTPPRSEPSSVVENAVAATLTLLGFRLWISKSAARTQIAAGEFLVTSDTAGEVEATGKYAGHEARFGWAFSPSGNLRSFTIILDYDGDEPPAASPFFSHLQRALDDQHLRVQVGDDSCEWVGDDERITLSVHQNWPKGARSPKYLWYINLLSQREEPNPDPTVVMNRRINAAGATAQKLLQLAGIEAPVSPSVCLNQLTRLAPDRAIAVAESLEQACERRDVAAVLVCLSECLAGAPTE